ncbi:DsbA family protein [Pseudomonas helleri]|uniref:DsbA family protein n=1 Tax=Pseudomonas helleri TaxID=1608996 RepID=UPI003FCF60BC
MNLATLHYFYDPFCGWCYGAAPLVTSASEITGLKIEVHGIGMLSNERSKMVSAEWRDFVRPHELRISALSQQLFSDAYLEQVLDKTTVRLDSSPPTAAMLTAQKIGGRGVEMLKRLQIAYYQEGRAIADPRIIFEVAVDAGFDRELFAKTYQAVLQEKLEGHIADSNTMLSVFGGRGVPFLIVEKNGGFHSMPLGHYLGKPDVFKFDIEAILSA